MKRISKSFALLCMGLATVACVEENFEPNTGNYDTTPGNDIQFSAMAKVNNGNIQTKTEYGDVDLTKQYIEVNWSVGDKITIASPEAAGTNIAHYDIGFNADVEDDYSGSHAATVTKRGGVGLQWSESDKYTFYAMYPMLDTIEEDADFNGKSQLVLGNDGEPAVLKGYLPVAQNPKSVRTTDGNYVVAPDMRYAYMVAYDEFDRPNEGETSNAQDKISLPFKSLSTVLQFQLTAGMIANQNQGQTNIKITSVMLYSSKGNPICGPFTYSFPVEEDQTGNSLFDVEGADGTSQASFSRLTMDFASLGQDIILSKDKSLDLTFFLLPIVNFTKDIEDLKLQVFYEINGSPQYMVAKLGVDIQASRKYYFKNMKMKDLTTPIDGSSWIGGMDDNVLLSQLSIPCAGNVFSNQSGEKYHKQQTNDYLRLWDLGVRGFEMASDYDVDAMNQTFADQKFVVGEQYVGTLTFGEAFTNLVAKLDQSADECLIIIATYAACQADYNPQQYVKDLLSYLGSCGVDKDRFVRLTPSSTVGTIRNKIAVIIRPGDDDYMRHWFDGTTSSIQLIDNDNVSWADNVMLVQNWGTAYDRWDMRYDGFTREAIWGEGTSNGWNAGSNYRDGSDGKSVMENYLYSWSTARDTYNAASGYGYKVLPTLTENLQYSHTLASGESIHVQEWARVSPRIDEYDIEAGGNGLSTGSSHRTSIIGGTTHYLWVRWPESISQKKKAIDQTFLAAVKHNDGSQAYINVLSGYYITQNYPNSMMPYKYRDSSHGSSLDRYRFSNQGKGGNYAALAAELNTYTYNILSGKSAMSSTGNVLPVGPWGLVMIDFVGTDFAAAKNNGIIPTPDEFGADLQEATEASAKLCNLILMNNFKFPLETIIPPGGNGGSGGNGSTGGGDNTEGGEEEGGEGEGGTPSEAWVGDYDSVYLDGENAISFE